MLTFCLIEETPHMVVYQYFPEGGTDSGVVSFDKTSKKISIVTLSVNDKHQIYALKLFARIRKYSENDFFSKQGIIAWC